MRWIYKILIFLSIILGILIFSKQMMITIYSGEGGVLFKRWGGTVINRVYKEGIHFIFPWNIMTIYNLRVQDKRHNFTILSKQGLTIKIKISIRFKPEKKRLAILHQNLGPKYLDSVVIPEVESVIRRYFGQFNDEEIYTSKRAILEKIVNHSRKHLEDKFIILDDLIIREISFPKLVENAIEEKIVEYHRYKKYEYTIEKERLEAKRKIIEAHAISQYKNIISENITPNYLSWEGIQATVELSKSTNSKVIIIGSGKNGLPIILNTENNNEK